MIPMLHAKFPGVRSIMEVGRLLSLAKYRCTNYMNVSRATRAVMHTVKTNFGKVT